MMYGRTGLERFKKAQSSEPFSVIANPISKLTAAKSISIAAHQPLVDYARNEIQIQPQTQPRSYGNKRPLEPEAGPLLGQTQQVTQIGGGQSTWRPPDWAIEPRPGVYYLEVLKDGEVLDQINLDRRKHIFGRQSPTCDFVLDHQSVSRQHAAVVPHKNGSIFVIDLGSAHGTFVANERLTKDTPMELEAGQSLRFAASTRTYILKKNDAHFQRPPPAVEVNLPPPPDPSDEEAVVSYNTLINRYGLGKKDDSLSAASSSSTPGVSNNSLPVERLNARQWRPGGPAKKMKKARVGFRDLVGGELVEIVGVSDGTDVETEPGPVGVKEGSLVGKYESLVQSTVIPIGAKEQQPPAVGEGSAVSSVQAQGVTNKLKEVLNKMKLKAIPRDAKDDDDLYGESFSGKVGSGWASAQLISSAVNHSHTPCSYLNDVEDDDDDDLFGD